MNKPALLLILFVVTIVMGCASPIESVESLDVEKLSTSPLPFISTLSEFETETLVRVKKKPEGEELFHLALIMGGEVRTREAVAPLRAKYESFLSSVKGATKDIKKPRETGRVAFEMFHAELLGQKGRELNNYEKDQTTVDGILERREYNCLSSSILFGLIAEDLGFDVLGVKVPSHVFIELKHKKSGVSIEVETTAATGFDLKHDKAFFESQSASWASERGLRPTTYEEYKKRVKISFPDLIASMHNVQHTHERVMDLGDRNRLAEIGGYLSDSRAHQRARLAVWTNVLTGLVTAGRPEDVVRVEGPILDVLIREAKRFKGDDELKTIATAALDMGAVSLSKIGRHKEAMKRANLIDGIYNYKMLRPNRVFVFQNAAVPFYDRDDWASAIKIYAECQKGFEDAPTNSCRENMQYAYLNWSEQLRVKGDGAGVKSVLKKCVLADKSFEICKQKLDDSD